MKRNGNQKNLFDWLDEALPPPPLNPTSYSFEWSYSRRDLFERCARWYYYNYYGAAANKAKLEPLKQQLKFLKTLSNRYLRAGELLHLVIGTYLKKYKGGEIWTVERAIKWAEEMYRIDFDRSLNYQKTGHDRNKNDRSVLLAEFYFRQPDAESLWAESAQRLKKALSNFLTNPKLESFRQAALLPESHIEETIRIRDRGIRIRGKVDLAWTEGHTSKIVDWKIGESSSADDSLQLLSYALLVSEEFGRNPDSIEIYKAHLGDLVITSFQVNKSEVQRAKMRIIQDVQRMQAMAQYGKDGVAEAFTPCGQEKICQMCPFQQVCPKE